MAYQFEVKVVFTSVYFHQGNMTERYNKEVILLLRSYCFEKHTKWPNVLNFVEDCLNHSINLNTGFSPALLQTGKEIENLLFGLINFPEREGKPTHSQIVRTPENPQGGNPHSPRSKLYRHTSILNFQGGAECGLQLDRIHPQKQR